MGINSTDVAYGFGQMGSIHVRGTTAVTSNGVTASPGVGAEAVFVAITFLEDTTFNTGTGGLIAEQTQLYPDSTYTSTSIDADGGVVTDSETFPKGVTIYGRWTVVDVNAGNIIAYFG